MLVPRASTPNRIVCLTEEPVETLYLLGAEDRIVGVSGFTVRPKEARKKPKVSLFTSASYDRIRALEPDLVIGFSDLQADIARELVRLGVPVVIFNQRSVSEILSTILATGNLVGKTKEAEALVARLEANLEETVRAAASLPARPRVFFEEWNEPLIAGIRWVEELIELAGGEPIFPELRNAGLAKERIVSPDEVVRRAPDLILASWCGRKVQKPKIRERPGFSTIPAVVNDRIHEIPSSQILQPGPAALTDGLAAIRRHVEAAARALGRTPRP
ncbi:MAG: cobalamin-binding protein [Polyangiales bacterium]